MITQMYFRGRSEKRHGWPVEAPLTGIQKDLISRYGKPSGQQENKTLVVPKDIVLASG
ncbi:MAG: hypothetical protein IPP88_21980 [Betaproteobacteria bacterium]|nr:hypothetical protein [Betaproteobacteria bacterium]